MKEVFIIFIIRFLIIIYAFISWIVNLVKLLNCDFDAPFKDEIIHAIGLIPFASLVTCWF